MSRSRHLSSLAIAFALATVAVSARGQSVPPATQSGITDPSVGVPETGNASENQQIAATRVDPSTGMLSTSIAITSPPARGGAQPDLSIQYSSEAGVGYAGWGWTIDQPSIERRPYSGPPNYDAPPTTSVTSWTPLDQYYFEGKRLTPVCIAGSGACGGVQFPSAVSGWWYFRESEESDFARFFLSPNQLTWYVQYKSGVVMELGSPLIPASASFPPAIEYGLPVASALNPNPVIAPYRWYVTRKYDGQRTTGGVPVNVVAYVWQQPSTKVSTNKSAVGARLYLTSIYDTPSLSANSSALQYSSFAHHINLSYEASTHLTTSTFFSPVWRQTPILRLKAVDVTSAAFEETDGKREMVRRYHLTYIESGLRSFLSSVQVEGQCAAPTYEVDSQINPNLPTTSCPSRPAATFNYTTTGSQISLEATSVSGAIASGAYLVDLNSDGLPDFGGETSASLQSETTADTLNASVAMTPGISPLLSIADKTPLPFTPQAVSDLHFTTGNYLGDGNLNVGFIMPPTDETHYAVLLFTPNMASSPAAWTGGNTADIGLSKGVGDTNTTSGGQCIPPCAQTDNCTGRFGGDEKPYAAFDVDGDNYPDLLTYTPFVTCQWKAAGCNGTCVYDSNGNVLNVEYESIPTLQAMAIGLRTTRKNSDGSTAIFGVSRGNAAPPAAWAADIPTTGHYVQWLTNLPPNGGSGNFFPQDVNGDGLADLVTVSKTAISVVYSNGDGTVGLSSSGGPYTLTIPSYAASDPSKVFLHDINGDGLADVIVGNSAGITVYLNEDGLSFQAGQIETLMVNGVSVWNASSAQISFGDMNGSGVDDLVVTIGANVYYVDFLAGERPGLLQSMSNGIGGFTYVNYASTSDLARVAAQASTPWKSQSPQVLHHVTSVLKSNGLSGVYGLSTTAAYTYRDPVYDPRDQRFVGFRQVTEQRQGAGDDPTVNTRTTYLTGLCATDGGSACPSGGVDRPFLPLTGLPTLVEVFDGQGNFLSTTHTTYNVEVVAKGVDGSVSRFAARQTADRYQYDIAVPPPAGSSVTFTDAQISDVGQTVTSTSTVYGMGSAHLVKTWVTDTNGNVTSEIDDGAVGVDQPITTSTTWALPAGDTTGWSWRKNTQQTSGFPAVVGEFADVGRSVTLYYNSAGGLTDAYVTRAGSVALNRASGTASPPADMSAGATVHVLAYTYDALGNVSTSLGPNGTSCERIAYDSVFGLVPETDSIYIDTPQTCSGPALVSSATFDLGFGVPTLTVAPDGSMQATTYDGFGRFISLKKNDPSSTSIWDQHFAAHKSYVDYVENGSEVGEQILTQSWDGTYTTSAYAYTDGWGAPLVTLTQSASSDGSANPWIASGISPRGAKGSVTDNYQPSFSSTDPSKYDFGTIPTSASRHTAFDAFGNVVRTVGLDGVTDSVARFHALSVENWDALHIGTTSFVNTAKDGHGRTSVVTTYAAIGADKTTQRIKTSYAYTSAGQTRSITRTNGTASFTQNLAHDSLGNLVENQEPNSTSGTNDWRYVYNDSGELVGTSDARGCGENITYDAAGRKVTEDYSPCTPAQVPYSAPGSNMSGYEAIYAYDKPWQQNQTARDGHLHATIDRAQRSDFTYDARGRATHVAKLLAKPGDPSRDWSTRFAENTFTATTGYDDADRVSSRSTGANAVSLLVGGTSVVTTQYDQRGHVTTIGGSYGALLASSAFNAQGQPTSYTYSDAASTVASTDYDKLQRLWHSNVTRRASLYNAWAWGVTPSPDGTTSEANLEQKTYTYDAVGNPTLITDASNAIWPTGAKPILSKSIGYDDLYHVLNVTTNTGGDSFVQPFAPEIASGDDSVPPATILNTRIISQTFDYDWLGNTIASSDDRNAFYDRSLGTISNDVTHPNQMVYAVGATLSTGASSGGASVYYDAAGNVTQVNISRAGPCTSACQTDEYDYTWDEVGHLASASRIEVQRRPPVVIRQYPITVTYAYDGSGARVLSAFASDDVDNPTFSAEVFPSLRLDGATWNGTAYLDDVTTEQVYLVAGTGTVGRLAYAASDPITGTSGALHVFLELKDPLGSTSYVLDRSTGELVEKVAYQPYGALESDFRSPRWADFRETYKFGGKEDDFQVGLTYFGGRYYLPALGRWLSPDPVAVHQQQGNANVYAYAGGRVFSVTDPTGLSDVPEWSNGNDLGSMMNNLGVADSVAESVPGMSTAMALEMQWEESDPAFSYGNGFVNGVSDTVNGVSSFFGGGPIAPTFAPSPSGNNLFDALSYGAGGATSTGIVTSGLGAGEAVGQVAGAIGSWAEGGALLSEGAGSALSSFMADTRGGFSPGNLLGGEAMDGAAQGAGFPSFEAFKSAAGPAGDDMQWHHLVEQNPANTARFTPEALHNTGNLVRIPSDLHGQINAFYSSPNAAVTGSETMIVRQWVSGLGYAQQQQFGQAIFDAVTAP